MKKQKISAKKQKLLFLKEPNGKTIATGNKQTNKQTKTQEMKPSHVGSGRAEITKNSHSAARHPAEFNQPENRKEMAASEQSRTIAIINGFGIKMHSITFYRRGSDQAFIILYTHIFF